MNSAAFTAAEYRRIARLLERIDTHFHKLNDLFSKAYGKGHPLVAAMLDATMDDWQDFLIYLQNMASDDHPTRDWGKTFCKRRHLGHNLPDNIPSCTLEETQQISHAHAHRNLNKKHEPLTKEELAIAVRFYSHVAQMVRAITNRALDCLYLTKEEQEHLVSVGSLLHKALAALQREAQGII